MFKSARHFAAWFGLVPRQHFHRRGRPRLGRIWTKTGNREMRRLLVLGATSMVYRAPDNGISAAGPCMWIRGVLERRPVRLATVALANKMARIAWALMTAQRGLPGERTSRGAWPGDVFGAIWWAAGVSPAYPEGSAESRDGKGCGQVVQAIPVAALCLEARPTDWCLTHACRAPMIGQRRVPRDRSDIRAQLTGSFTRRSVVHEVDPLHS